MYNNLQLCLSSSAVRLAFHINDDYVTNRISEDLICWPQQGHDSWFPAARCFCTNAISWIK